jgi:ACS family tartrate transporter-like MFS transporter
MASPQTPAVTGDAVGGLALQPEGESVLDRARRKAFQRLIPLCFLCYVIAYVDRTNVSLAKLTMLKELKGFDDAVFGFGSGVFFVGYFLLEIPGTLIVERWSARKWISRIMLTWGVMAAFTAVVKTPSQFYTVRFLLGLAEAGFFPGIIVYLTHWFSSRDRARALAMFLGATPAAQIFSPKISNLLLRIGTTETIDGVSVTHPQVVGLQGWQWMYIGWGIPAVALGVIVLFALTDRPRDAKWLTAEEKSALENELEREKAQGKTKHRMKVTEALVHKKVLALALAYFLMVSANYGIEFFLPSILKDWYGLRLDTITWLVMLPPVLALAGQLFVGWSSDRRRERRLHAVIPILCGSCALMVATQSRGYLPLTIGLFALGAAGIKAYQPAFWSLPNLFLTEAAAAGSIGLINSVGNLGGFMGTTLMGSFKKFTGSFGVGIVVLASAMCLSATLLFFLGLGKKSEHA